MQKYELMVIIDPAVDARAVSSTLKRFLDVISDGGGTIDTVDIWGRRPLAYEIRKRDEGVYAVVQFTSSAETAAELGRQLRLAETILREKILLADNARTSTSGPVSPSTRPAGNNESGIVGPALSSKPHERPNERPDRRWNAAKGPRQPSSFSKPSGA